MVAASNSDQTLTRGAKLKTHFRGLFYIRVTFIISLWNLAFDPVDVSCTA